MRTVTLTDGTRVRGLRKSETLILDRHVDGYLEHGIEVHDGDMIFDVGANIGLFGVRAIQRHPGVRVFAFEPVPAIVEVLRANASVHGDGRLVVLPCGLSRAPGHVEIDYFPNSPAMSTADVDFWDKNPGFLRQVVKGNARHAPRELWYGRLVPGFLAGAIAWNLRRGVQRVTCELRTVSQVMREQQVNRIDLLKVDCEGAELDVLLGIEAEHWPQIGKVVAEVADVDGRLDAVRELLHRHGFDRIAVERERGFEATPMVNIFATRANSD